MPEDKPIQTEEVTPITKPQPTASNGFAIASFVVGIVAFMSGWIPFWGVLSGSTAVVLGALALKNPASKGLAIAGIITGGLAALTSILFTLAFITSVTSYSTF
ncbi:MAG: hypothetical protein JWO54_148 [Candidatus Saccharibacteria bacterium]|nr:hypothetical protein [Candidatus Saccharibacteria bacterium]